MPIGLSLKIFVGFEMLVLLLSLSPGLRRLVLFFFRFVVDFFFLLSVLDMSTSSFLLSKGKVLESTADSVTFAVVVFFTEGKCVEEIVFTVVALFGVAGFLVVVSAVEFNFLFELFKIEALTLVNLVVVLTVVVGVVVVVLGFAVVVDLCLKIGFMVLVGLSLTIVTLCFTSGVGLMTGFLVGGDLVVAPEACPLNKIQVDNPLLVVGLSIL